MRLLDLDSGSAGALHLSTRLRAAVEELRRDAAKHDAASADLRELVRPLVEADLFKETLPSPSGVGLATDPNLALELHDVLKSVGAANLSAGRIFEGHVNAVKLVFAFGNDQQRENIGKAVSDGALMGVWNAEQPPGVGLRPTADGAELTGSKIYASGVGLLQRPLITARAEDGGVLMTIPVAAASAPFDLSGWTMRGMRATATGTIHLEGVLVADAEIVGGPGDYYRSPGFRGGAWRFAAVQLGALDEIVTLMAAGLRARGRNADPHQKARMGQAAIAVRTAELWTRHAAQTVEGGPSASDDADAIAGMARLVVERTSLEVIGLAERALGLLAFSEAEPIERIVRDLSTYLRQPFPDAVLEGVGDWAMKA